MRNTLSGQRANLRRTRSCPADIVVPWTLVAAHWYIPLCLLFTLGMVNTFPVIM